ncbi:MAG: 30S ribosomal protein S12 methylthiotransferase RimO [Muribaculaceae bacterium]
MLVNLITMGCSKNLVDTGRVGTLLSESGFEVSSELSFDCGGIVVINTCGFIGDAKEESIEMILSACKAKAEGMVDAVYVMGCLSERYRTELPESIPEVDGWYGKFDWRGLAADLAAKYEPDASEKPTVEADSEVPVSAYIKIAEGCNRFCAFCAIPIITGRYVSRPVEEVLDEVRRLAAAGTREFNIIAQDLSYYGRDIYGGQSALARLIDAMADIEGVEWIRLHYAYPADFPYDVLEVMARRTNVCKYLDIALQHISDKVLTNMRRHIDAEGTRRLLARIRAAVPGIHIRTTLMVGFPGEGEAEYEELLAFVKEQRFERMGAFAYCEEEDTYAAMHYADDIPQEVKNARLDRLMAIQEEISYDVNRAKIGSTLRVLVTDENDDYYVGRTQFDSPEVDPEVLITKDCALATGTFVDVEITGAEPYELIGRVC